MARVLVERVEDASTDKVGKVKCQLNKHKFPIITSRQVSALRNRTLLYFLPVMYILLTAVGPPIQTFRDRVLSEPYRAKEGCRD